MVSVVMSRTLIQSGRLVIEAHRSDLLNENFAGTVSTSYRGEVLSTDGDGTLLGNTALRTSTNALGRWHGGIS